MGLARKLAESGEGRRPYREDLDPSILDFYRDCMATLTRQGVEFVVGGTCALTHFAGMTRYTHDLDIFVRGRDVRRALRVLSRQGYHTHLTFPHWLGKAMCGGGYVDLIFSSGNGVVLVDDVWFEQAAEGEVLGVPVLLCPAEEMIWSKAFIMERERFDGGDVAHILRTHATELDWRRLVDRFGSHWRVLYSHLVLFGFIYPDARDAIPAEVMRELGERLAREVEAPPPEGKVCQGTLLSRAQYLSDVDHWGYRDARLAPLGGMTAEDIAWWTSCIERDQK